MRSLSLSDHTIRMILTVLHCLFQCYSGPRNIPIVRSLSLFDHTIRMILTVLHCLFPCYSGPPNISYTLLSSTLYSSPTRCHANSLNHLRRRTTKMTSLMTMWRNDLMTSSFSYEIGCRSSWNAEFYADFGTLDFRYCCLVRLGHLKAQYRNRS